MDRTSISPWPLLLSPCPVYENPPVRIETGPSSHCYWSLAYPSHPDTSPRILYHPTQHQSTAYSCTWTPKLKINLPCSFFLPFSSYLQCRMWGFLCNSAKRPVAVCLLFRFSRSCQLSTSEVSVFRTRDPDVFVHFFTVHHTVHLSVSLCSVRSSLISSTKTAVHRIAFISQKK